MPSLVAANSDAQDVFAISNIEIVESNPAPGIFRLFVFILPYACSSLPKGWLWVQGLLPSVCKIHTFRIILLISQFIGSFGFTIGTACMSVIGNKGHTALQLWRMPSSGILRCVALVRTDVSEELIASISVFLRSVHRLLVTAKVFPRSPILVTLVMKALLSSETFGY
jgi:hypothetical protein